LVERLGPRGWYVVLYMPEARPRRPRWSILVVARESVARGPPTWEACHAASTTKVGQYEAFDSLVLLGLLSQSPWATPETGVWYEVRIGGRVPDDDLLRQGVALTLQEMCDAVPGYTFVRHEGRKGPTVVRSLIHWL
jgi:hypothetical protein